jgi:hypothetical protein
MATSVDIIKTAALYCCMLHCLLTLLMLQTLFLSEQKTPHYHVTRFYSVPAVSCSACLCVLMLQGAPAHDSLFLPEGAVGVFTLPQDWAVARTARQGQPLTSDVDRYAGPGGGGRGGQGSGWASCNVLRGQAQQRRVHLAA